MLSKGAVTMCERRRACKILRPGASCLASSICLKLPPITPCCKHLPGQSRDVRLAAGQRITSTMHVATCARCLHEFSLCLEHTRPSLAEPQFAPDVDFIYILLDMALCCIPSFQFVP